MKNFINGVSKEQATKIAAFTDEMTKMLDKKNAERKVRATLGNEGDIKGFHTYADLGVGSLKNPLT